MNQDGVAWEHRFEIRIAAAPILASRARQGDVLDDDLLERRNEKRSNHHVTHQIKSISPVRPDNL